MLIASYNGITKIDSNYMNNDLLIDRMCQDSIIASAIDMWTEDALQKDPYSGTMFKVEVDTPDDQYENELSKGLSKELYRFLTEDLRMEKYLSSILKRIIKYGDAHVKLDFADALVDDKLTLVEANRDYLSPVNDKIKSILTEKEVLSDMKMVQDNEHLKVDYEKYGNQRTDLSNRKWNLKEHAFETTLDRKQRNQLLTEAELTSFKKMLKGRWYTETIGRGTNLYAVYAKQKLIAYVDRDHTDKFIKPDRIINFTNNTGKHKVTFEVGGVRETADKKEYYQLERGESFLENAMTAWQVLSAMEDILLLTRMTRSLLYRIFSVEVGAKGNKETYDILERLKNKIKADETVDVRNRIYNSNLSQVPLGDSIFIPTRNGVGVIDVKTVGGDINMTDAVDLDYFKDKLFAALRTPKAYFGFGEDTAGMMNTSLTQLDIRYCRTVQRLQTILAEGLKDLCLKYLEMTRTRKALEELPDFRIIFTSVNSAEDSARAELKQKQMETLGAMIERLASLGITFDNDMYSKTRDKLLKEFFGSDLFEKVREDEKIQPVIAPTGEDGRNLGGGVGSSPDGSTSRPSDIISGPGIDEEPIEEIGDEELLDLDDETIETEPVDDGTDLDTGVTPPEDTVGREIG